MSVEMFSNANLKITLCFCVCFKVILIFLIPEEENNISSQRKTSAEYKPGK